MLCYVIRQNFLKFFGQFRKLVRVYGGEQVLESIFFAILIQTSLMGPLLIIIFLCHDAYGEITKAEPGSDLFIASSYFVLIIKLLGDLCIRERGTITFNFN